MPQARLVVRAHRVVRGTGWFMVAALGAGSVLGPFVAAPDVRALMTLIAAAALASALGIVYVLRHGRRLTATEAGLRLSTPDWPGATLVPWQDVRSITVGRAQRGALVLDAVYVALTRIPPGRRLALHSERVAWREHARQIGADPAGPGLALLGEIDPKAVDAWLTALPAAVRTERLRPAP
ncbi:hypothetical protein [Kitasatospora sp. NPDC004531]